MERITYYRRLFAYDAWANQEVLVALERADPLPPLALKRMAHILGSQSTWLRRLGHAADPLAVWPDLTLDDCEALLGRLAYAWESYLQGRADADLAAPVDYATSGGEAWTNRVDEILTHVAMHGAYHRGQIASDLRAAGSTPAATDFILAARQGAVPLLDS